jgi:hypothetical protein
MVAVAVLVLVAPLPAGALAAEHPALPVNPPVLMVASRFVPGDGCLAREGDACLRSSEPLTIRQGSSLEARNLDLPRHDLRSADVDPDTGRLLFSTDILTPGKPGAVRGVEELEPGLYRYYCTLHPPAADGTGMRGLLRVVEGTEQ